jgi:hypothetical protein
MGDLFGFHSSVIGGPRLAIGLGPLQSGNTVAEPNRPKQHLFAFSLPLKSGRPKVFMYENNDQGRSQLANLIRGENVLAVIHGTQVEIESASVVGLIVDQHKIVHKTLISNQ